MRIRVALAGFVLVLAAACGSTSADSDGFDAATDDVSGDTIEGPTFEIEQPADGAVYLPGLAVPFEIHTTCIGCTIRVTSSLDGRLIDERPSSSGALSTSVGDLRAGVHVLSLQLLHPDGRVLRDASRTVRIDTVPGAPVVHLEPLEPTTDDTLTVVFDSYATDPDNDPVSYTYRWSRNGTLAQENGSKTLSATVTARGETWTVAVIPRDPWGEGPSGSAQVVIGDSAPSITTVVVLPSVGTADTAFSCAYHGWSDPDAGDPELPRFVFLRNGGEIASVDDTSPTFPGGHQRGDELACRVIPSDGVLEGEPVQSAAVVIADAPPVVGSAQLLPATGDVTDTFTCAPGALADPDGDPVTVTIRWRVDGVLLPGETSETVEGSLFARGQRLACEVVPSDGVLDGFPVASNEVLLADAPPVLAAAMLAPAEATEETTLTCTIGAAVDPDGDDVGFVIDWLVDGLPVDEEHGATLTGARFDKGQGVECAVTPEANGLFGDLVFAKPVVQVVNTPPTLAGARVVPEEGGRQTLFTCEATGFVDPDPTDDPAIWALVPDPQDTSTPGFTYAWYLNGQKIAGAYDPTFRPTTGAPGQALRCRISVTDGQVAAVPADAPNVTLVNHAPSVADVTLTPDEPTEADVLLCSANQGIDPDDDALQFLVDWLVNGETLSDEAQVQLDGASFGEGDVVACRVTPVDMFGLAGEPVTSPAVTVQNSVPVVQSVSLTPAAAGPYTTFTCTPEGLADADPGDTPLPLFHWWRNGVAVEGAGLATYAVGAAANDETVRCSVTPFDGDVQGVEVASNTVVLQNQAPSVASVAITPAGLTTETPAVCAVEGVVDPEGEAVTLAFDWYLNSALVADVTSDTLPADRFVRGDTLFCVVTPSDGTASGSPRTSALVTVLNSVPGPFDVAITPAEPSLADETLQCAPTVVPADADGDSPTYAYAWALDDGAALGVGATLSTNGLARCDLVRCAATASDGYGGASQATSAPVVIDGSFGARFDGASSRVVVAAAPELASPGALTLEAWVRLDGPCPTAWLATRGAAGGSRVALGLTASGAVRFELTTEGAGAGTLTLESASLVVPGTWVHVAGQWDGAAARLFVQGALQSGAALGGFLSTAGDLAIGAAPFAGVLDDLRLSSIARYDLSFVPSTTAAADADTILLYRFERVVANGVVDAGPKGLDGQPTALIEAGGACFESGQPDLPPTAPEVTLTPLAPTVDQDLVCQVVVPSTDPEGAAVTYTPYWYVDGVLAADLTGQWVYSAAQTDFCDLVTCRVAPSDGALTGPYGSATVQVEAPIVNEYVGYFTWPSTPAPEHWTSGWIDNLSYGQTFEFTEAVTVLGLRFYHRGVYNNGQGKMRWRYDHSPPLDPDEAHFGTKVPYSDTGATFQQTVDSGWNTYWYPTPIVLDQPVVVMWTFSSGGSGTGSTYRYVYFDDDGANPATRNWIIPAAGAPIKAVDYNPSITGDFLIELILEGDQSGVCP